jgi:hypothetical protein
MAMTQIVLKDLFLFCQLDPKMTSTVDAIKKSPVCKSNGDLDLGKGTLALATKTLRFFSREQEAPLVE